MFRKISNFLLIYSLLFLVGCFPFSGNKSGPSSESIQPGTSTNTGELPKSDGESKPGPKGNAEGIEGRNALNAVPRERTKTKSPLKENEIVRSQSDKELRFVDAASGKDVKMKNLESIYDSLSTDTRAKNLSKRDYESSQDSDFGESEIGREDYERDSDSLLEVAKNETETTQNLSNSLFTNVLDNTKPTSSTLTSNSSSASAQSGISTASKDPYYTYNALLLKMTGDGPVSDVMGHSVRSFGITPNANNGVFGDGAAEFSRNIPFGPYAENFTPSYLQIDSDNLNFGSDDFTIEFYFKIPEESVTNASSAVYFASQGWVLRFVNGGNLQFVWRNAQSKAQLLSGATTRPAPNRWHYIAVSRTGSTVKLFMNGQAIASNKIDQVLFSSESLLVGMSSSIGIGMTGGRAFGGSMNYFRITKGIGRYESNFVPPSLKDF